MPITSPDILLADDIVAALNAAELSQEFTAERVYVPDWDDKDELATLQVAVWPEEPTADPFERVGLVKTYPIAVGFAKRLTAKTRAEIDALCDLVYEVVRLLELQTATLDDGTAYLNTGWEFRLRFHMDSLEREKHSSVVTYTGRFASVVSFPFVLLD